MGVDPASGLLSIDDGHPTEGDDVKVQVKLSHAEGPVGVLSLELTFGSHQSWLSALDVWVQRFEDTDRYPLDWGVRVALQERFAEIYDYEAQTTRPCDVGQWLKAAM